MSVMANAREVLSHLNYLGYTNISAHQLKEFMIDLKRFIKYEEQCQQQPHIYNGQENEDPQEDIFECLHKTDTIASKAKKKPTSPKKQLKQHVITLQINNPGHSSHLCTNSVPKLILPQSEIDDSESRQSTNRFNCINRQCNQVVPLAPSTAVSKVSVAGSLDQMKSIPSTTQSVPTLPLTATTTATNLETSKKSARPKSSRSSFIRPRIANKPIKSDPVALYHQYKQEWDKIKFPGEHQHGQTRWAIREKLLGDR